MMNMRVWPVLAVLASAGVPQAQAAEDGPLSAYLGGGFEYDSNITVDAQDLTTGQGDVALVVEGGISGDWGDADSLGIRAGYDFFQNLHESLGDFDLQTHSFSVGADKTVADLDLGLDFGFSHIRLGGDALLNLSRVSPSVGKLLSNNIYVVGAYEFQDRNFDQLNDRDSSRHAFSGTAYYFMDGGQYVYGEYEIARDDARASRFTYWGHYFTVGFASPLMLASREVELDLRYQYYRRNYSGVTPSIAAERSDKRHDIRAGATVPLFDSFAFKLDYEYIAASSNLASADYNEHILTGTVRWEY